jgi:glycosyltransferase involved in cell wall biosynthesis
MSDSVTGVSQRPNLSVTIPVRNGASTLALALSSIPAAVGELSYEVIVIDGGSSDGSLEIARRCGCTVIQGDHKLLAARRLGVKASSAPVVVLLDADQILCEGSLAQAVQAINEGAEIVALGERVWRPTTAFQRWSDADKQLIEMNVASQLDPMRGVILPRVFDRQIINGAFEAIPLECDSYVIAMDHAMVCYEASRLSNRVDYVPSAVFHNEPKSIFDVWAKNYRYGKSIAVQRRQKSYVELITAKNRRLLSSKGPIRLKWRSIFFLAAKAPAYFLGEAIGRRPKHSRSLLGPPSVESN